MNPATPQEQDAAIVKADCAMICVRDELIAATARYGQFNSPHEGYAVIKEELEELWDEIKKRPAVRNAGRMEAEAIQLAAMTIRFIVDCT